MYKRQGIFRFVSAEPSSAGNAPLSLLDDTVPNLASATVPDANWVAFKVVMLAPEPSKDVDVVTPVTTAPSGKVGETPAVLPLKLVTLKLDIRDLRFEVRQ